MGGLHGATVGAYAQNHLLVCPANSFTTATEITWRKCAAAFRSVAKGHAGASKGLCSLATRKRPRQKVISPGARSLLEATRKKILLRTHAHLLVGSEKLARPPLEKRTFADFDGNKFCTPFILQRGSGSCHLWATTSLGDILQLTLPTTQVAFDFRGLPFSVENYFEKRGNTKWGKHKALECSCFYEGRKGSLPDSLKDNDDTRE